MRNWDYRYCWLRDATFTLMSLMVGGYVDEARAWRDWLLRAIAGQPEKMQIMYGAAGERRLSESVLEWLPGYQGAAPVRVGNAAADQFQLDVYGELMDALHQARIHGLDPDPSAWAIQRALLDVAIVGTGLRYVEQVASRMTTGRAALYGAGQAILIGLLFALLFGIFFTVEEAFLGLLIYSVVIGLLFGAIFRAPDHAATGGRRDFASTVQMQAERYEVQVDSEVADRAITILREMRVPSQAA